MSMGGSLEPELVGRLRAIQSLKAGALGMFDPMLRRVGEERDCADTSAEVAELLGRMHGVFSSHREETAEHGRAMAERIQGLGGAIADRRTRAISTGARGWVAVGGLGGTNHGANARNAFVFEHLEIASLKLLEQLGERAGDEVTVALARRCLAQDQEMAATIDRNWANVLTLDLAG